MRNVFNFLKELTLVYNLGVGSAPFKKKLRIVRYFIRKNLLKESIPITVIIGVTYRCQCNCRHCSVDNYRSDNYRLEMSTNEIKACIDEISSLGCVKVNFFGGEPLLREDIIELVSYTSKKDLFVFIDTNGFLLNKSMARRLKNADLSCVIISLDSSVEFKHDSLRGKKGLYRRAINGVRYCMEEGIPCVISTIATHDSINSGDLENLIRIAKNLGVVGVRVLLPMLSGKWNLEKDYLLTEEERNRLFRYLEPGFVYLESGFSYKKGRINRRICFAATKRLIYISPYGDLQLCYTVPYSFGNIRNNSLKEIINFMWNHELFKVAPRFECMMNDDNYRMLVMRNKSKI